MLFRVVTLGSLVVGLSRVEGVGGLRSINEVDVVSGDEADAAEQTLELNRVQLPQYFTSECTTSVQVFPEERWRRPVSGPRALSDFLQIKLQFEAFAWASKCTVAKKSDVTIFTRYLPDGQQRALSSQKLGPQSTARAGSSQPPQ